MPWLIDSLVTSDTYSFVARLALTSFFWVAGIFGLLNPKLIEKEIADAGLSAPQAIAWLMILTELCGSALLISDVRGLGWLGAGWLGVFTFLSIPLGHAFWKHPQPRRMTEFQIALEHLAVIGGLMCAASLLAA